MKLKDPTMHKRVAEEFFKLADTNRGVADKLGCEPDMVSHWICGKYIPSAYYLAAMHRVGCDVIYILTGERTR